MRKWHSIDFYLVHSISGKSWNHMRGLRVREFSNSLRGPKQCHCRIDQLQSGWVSFIY
jgi:predicted aldo/keto reductase-like oxidoreductase